MFSNNLKISLINLFLLISSYIIHAIQSPICIIGAGPSGLYSALKLQQKGYSTVVFDERNEIGGKVESYIFPEINAVAELSALFVDESSQQLLNLFEIYNISLIDTRSTTNLIKLNAYNQDGLNIFIPEQLLNVLLPPVIRNGIEKYFQIRKKYPEVSNYSLVGYDNIHPDLTLSFYQFLELHKITEILPLFYPIIPCEGFGSVYETPALYVLRIGSEVNIRTFGFRTQSIKILRDGYENMLRKIANDLPDIRLNSLVVKAERFSNVNQRIFYIKNGKRFQQNCNKIIMAFPPLLERVQTVFNNLNNFEKSLFSKVVHTKYFASIIISKNYTLSNLFFSDIYVEILRHNIEIPGGLITSIPDLNFLNGLTKEPDGNGEVVATQDIYAPGLFSLYSWIKNATSKITSQEDITLAYNKLIPTFKIAVPNAISPYIFRFRSFDYFPRLLTDALRDNWYKRLRSLQGYLGTYYTSAILDYETVGATMRAADHLIDTYF